MHENETLIYALFDSETNKVWDGGKWTSDYEKAQTGFDLEKFSKSCAKQLGSIFFDKKNYQIANAQTIANNIAENIEEENSISR